MEFEDKHSFNATHFYPCPNEGTREWHDMLKGTPIYRAAGISSSGEVGLFGILPLVRRKLVLIDHSYASLNAAMSKAHVLADLGPDEMFRLFTTAEHEETSEALLKVQDKLPVSVKLNCKGDRYSTSRSHWFTCSEPYPDERYNPTTGRYEIIPVVGTKKVSHTIREIQYHWVNHITVDMVRRAYDKLHMVKFIHGDLQHDLRDDGPYGLLYLSNATEHSNRDRKHPQFAEIRKCLRPNGYVITASRSGLYGYDPYDYRQKPVHDAVQLKSQRGGTLNWQQKMFRMGQKQAVAA